MQTQELKIMIVEDDESLAYLLQENFAESGFNIKLFQDGKTALEEIIRREYDLYILDLMLPDTNGFELAKQIRRRYPGRPFIFLTAVKTDHEKFEGYELGADDFITKPFSFKELEYKVRVILRRRFPEEEELPLIEIEDLRFDPNKREVYIADEFYKLTKKEAQLLLMLTNDMNNYVSRKTVLERLWERDDIYTTRSMDVYIARIRKIIAQSKFLVIENLYGSGHRLINKNKIDEH